MPPTKPAKSDASWFSPRTNQEPGFIPECSVEGCPEPSTGAELLQSLPGALLGRPRWLARFFCERHAVWPLSIYTKNLFQYKIAGRTELGTYKLHKLSEAEQNHRALLREKERRGGPSQRRY